MPRRFIGDTEEMEASGLDDIALSDLPVGWKSMLRTICMDLRVEIPEVRITRKRTRRRMAYANVDAGEIVIHQSAKRVGTLLHELAHLVADQEATHDDTAHSECYKSAQRKVLSAYYAWAVKHGFAPGGAQCLDLAG